MKIFGKKPLKGSILLFISYMAVSLCIILIVSAINYEKINEMSRDTLYTKNKCKFMLNNLDEKKWESIVTTLCEEYDNFAIYHTIPDETIVVRGILTDGTVQKPPMISGKFFDKETSWSDKPAIVLGREMEKDIYETSGELFYDYKGTSYNVIGVMGTEIDSRLNHMMLIDFKSLLKLEYGGEFIFDAADYDTAEEAYETMNSLFSVEDGFFMTLKQENVLEDTLIAKLMSSSYIMKSMYAMAFVSFSLCTTLVTLIWMRHRRQQFFVWKMTGYKRIWEIAQISKQYYKVTILAYVVGVIFMKCIMFNMKEFVYTWVELVKAFGITVGLGSVILYGCYFMRKE